MHLSSPTHVLRMSSALLVTLFFFFTGSVATTLDYVMLEEREAGHVIGTIATDADVDMSKGHLRLVV